MTTITDFQKNLLSEIELEFERLNPKKQNNTNKRFSIETIKSCINEKENFINSIKAYNKLMVQNLEDVFNSEIDYFIKEFGDFIYINEGFYINSRFSYDYTSLKNATLENGIANSSHYIWLYIVSKTKKHTDTSSFFPKPNNFDGMQHIKLYCFFKTEKVNIILESGEHVCIDKIIGLTFSQYEKFRIEQGISNNSLYGLFNENKVLQRDLIRLCN